MRIGVDLGGSKIEAVVLDDAGIIRGHTRVATPRAGGYEAITAAIATLVAHLEAQVQVRCTIGIGTPGAISHTTGAIKNSNTTCLNGRPLQQDLEQLLGRPIRLENDANCLALSEARDGAARDHGCVFAVILGTGVGGGLVINKTLWSGRQRIAGEWGHNTLDPQGPDCYCGHRGCVETLLSGPGLVADYQKHGGDRTLDAPALVAAARKGEPLAAASLHRYGERLGRALSVVVNILDPDIIVLGGGLSTVPEIYAQGRRALAAWAFTDDCVTPIVPAAHGPASGVRGAAHLW